MVRQPATSASGPPARKAELLRASYRRRGMIDRGMGSLAWIKNQKFRRLRCGSHVGLPTAHGNTHQFSVAQLRHARDPLVQFGGLIGCCAVMKMKDLRSA